MHLNFKCIQNHLIYNVAILPRKNLLLQPNKKPHALLKQEKTSCTFTHGGTRSVDIEKNVSIVFVTPSGMS